MKKNMEVPWSGVGHDFTEYEIDCVAKIMRETKDTFTQGKYLKAFEQKFCDYNQSQFAFAVSNCTAALELSAVISGVGPGDEVIIPAHTFCATAIPFGRTGARIVWADIDPETLVVTAETLSEKITTKTKAMVVVHLYGLAANMESIMELAKKHNILVVEDCAQALGAESRGRKVGSFGDFGCFSFHTHKNITTLGEGGMLTVKDAKYAAMIPGLRHNGLRDFEEKRKRYWVPAMSNVTFDLEQYWPYNFCIGEVQCALGVMLLDRFDQLLEYRRKRAKSFIDAVQDYPELVFQKIPAYHSSSFHLLPAKYNKKVTGQSNHDFIEIMFGRYNVKVIVQYYPLNRYSLFQKAGFGNAKCPVTDEFFDNMVSFPFHSWMPEEQFEYMIQATIETLNLLRNR